MRENKLGIIARYILTENDGRQLMAKMKSGDIGTDRAADKIRDIEVTLDFTPNADASVLYRQGETMVLACATVALHSLDGFLATPTEDGYTQNIPSYPVLQIHDSSVRGAVQRAELKKLRDWLLEAFVEQST